MKITQEDVVDRQTVLHIELEEEDLAPYLERGYKRAVQRVAIPGFRKGKAPRSIVERYVGRESLLNEMLDDMLPELTNRAIATQELEIAGVPKVDLQKLEPLTIDATVALPPEVDLGAYRDIRIEEPSVEITDDDVQKRLREMLDAAAPWEPVERPVKLGDMVTMDVTGRVQDKQVLDWKDSVYVVNEGDAQPFPGFAGHLQDLEVGTPKEFSLEIPSDYADASLAGGEMHLVATLTEVKQRVLPELDDEFAKGVGDGFESLEDLRASVEKDLQDEAERTRQTQYREAALDGLTSAATVELAPLLVEHDIEHMINRRDQLVERLNMTLDDYLRVTGKTDEEIRAEMREHAIERFTRSYALSTLAEREGLEVSGEEIDEKIQAIASSSDENAESLEGKDLDSEEVRDSIRETLLVTKALDRLTLIARGEAKEDIDRVQSTDDEKPESEEEGART